MAVIKTSRPVPETEVNHVLNAIEHRATWMALILAEAEKEEANWEEIGRNAISKCGSIHGAKHRSHCPDPENIGEFGTIFLDDISRCCFQIESVESNYDMTHVHFHRCPLVNAWKKLGLSDEKISKLCDIAMEGDRGIAKTMGCHLELRQTIAGGDSICDIAFIKD